MESSQRGRNALLTTLGIVALVGVVAIASRGSTPSGGAGTRRPSDTLLDILLSLYLVALVAGAILMLYLLALRRTNLSQLGGRRQRIRRNAVGFVILVGIALLITRDLSSRRLDELDVNLPQAPRAGEATPAGSGRDVSEADFAWIPVSITLALLAVAVFGFWWSGRSRRHALGRGDPLADALEAALDESLEDLRAEPDPRRAVIAAYARLERVLASHGLPRKTSEAPLEYLGRMLSGLSVSPPAARRLTDLFERAKFSHHAVGAEMKEHAIGALETVRDDLAAARALAEAERAAALEAQRARAAG
jgi:nitrogen fixation-related uncharacterized protein